MSPGGNNGNMPGFGQGNAFNLTPPGPPASGQNQYFGARAGPANQAGYGNQPNQFAHFDLGAPLVPIPQFMPVQEVQRQRNFMIANSLADFNTPGAATSYMAMRNSIGPDPVGQNLPTVQVRLAQHVGEQLQFDWRFVASLEEATDAVNAYTAAHQAANTLPSPASMAPEGTPEEDKVDEPEQFWVWQNGQNPAGQVPGVPVHQAQENVPMAAVANAADVGAFANQIHMNAANEQAENMQAEYPAQLLNQANMMYGNIPAVGNNMNQDAVDDELLQDADAGEHQLGHGGNLIAQPAAQPVAQYQGNIHNMAQQVGHQFANLNLNAQQDAMMANYQQVQSQPAMGAQNQQQPAMNVQHGLGQFQHAIYHYNQAVPQPVAAPSYAFVPQFNSPANAGNGGVGVPVGQQIQAPFVNSPSDNVAQNNHFANNNGGFGNNMGPVNQLQAAQPFGQQLYAQPPNPQFAQPNVQFAGYAAASPAQQMPAQQVQVQQVPMQQMQAQPQAQVHHAQSFQPGGQNNIQIHHAQGVQGVQPLPGPGGQNNLQLHFVHIPVDPVVDPIVEAPAQVEEEDDDDEEMPLVPVPGLEFLDAPGAVGELVGLIPRDNMNDGQAQHSEHVLNGRARVVSVEARQRGRISQDALQELVDKKLFPHDEARLSAQDKAALFDRRSQWLLDHRPDTTTLRRQSHLFVGREFGFTYSQIRQAAQLTNPESSLRGLWRTMSIKADHRVRTPVWTNADDQILISFWQHKYPGCDPENMQHVRDFSWTKVSDELIKNGISYPFSTIAIKRRVKMLIAAHRL